mmetsp:Transcript_912/g.1760  ORF Transcript_912/g.1760 Transcript_912/m.1760 type:complete len:92 (+) Transcript_912:1324-1599(+)
MERARETLLAYAHLFVGDNRRDVEFVAALSSFEAMVKYLTQQKSAFALFPWHLLGDRTGKGDRYWAFHNEDGDEARSDTPDHPVRFRRDEM